MKRKVLLILLILGALFSAPQAQAQLVFEYGFEGYAVLSDNESVTYTIENSDTSLHLVKSTTFTLPESKYIDGVFVQVNVKMYDDGDNLVDQDTITVTVKVNGATVDQRSKTLKEPDFGGSAYHTFYISVDYSDFDSIFTVDVYAQKTGYNMGHKFDVTVKYIVIYTTSNPMLIQSKLTHLNYIPPGAAGTESSLILNQTQVLLNSTQNLSEGSVAFWFFWDGRNVTISDNIQVLVTTPADTHEGTPPIGGVVVKNTDGTEYRLDDAVPYGAWVPIYIAWKPGYGYIAVNNTKITLNWGENLFLSKIGDIGVESESLIDEFKLWNIYLPLDQIQYELITQTYYLIFPDNTTVPIQVDAPVGIQPEGGQSLGTLGVTFLDENYTAIDTITLTPSQKTANVPNNTAMVLLSRDNTERFFFIPGIKGNPWAFPAEAATQLQIVTLTVYPPKYDILEIWTMDGKLATRVNMTGKTYTSFTAVYGKYYKFVVYSGNVSYTIVEQVKSDTLNLKFPQPEAFYQYSENEEKLVIQRDDNTATLIYTAPEVKDVNLTIKLFGRSNNIVYKFNESIHSVGFIKQVVLGDDIAYMTVDVSSPTYHAHRVVQNAIDFSYLVPDAIFPNGLRVGLFGMLGLFLVSRRYKYLAPFTATLLLSILAYYKVVVVDSELLLFGTVAAASAFITRNEGGAE